VPAVKQAIENAGLEGEVFVNKDKGISKKDRPYSHYVRADGTAAQKTADKLKRFMDSMGVSYETETLR
jgi:hypothetical protein